MNSSFVPLRVNQYGWLRLLLGGFLLVHFAQLLPYGVELFSSVGVLPADTSPLLGIIPNPLAQFDTPLMVHSLLGAGAMCGLLIAVGKWDRIAAFSATIILAWLFARNPLIANPSLPLVGWMLTAHLFMPSSRQNRTANLVAHEETVWHFPHAIWIAAWITLAVAYSYSGYTKLLSPSWLDGSAIATVLENPLARDHFVRVWLLSLPDWCLKVLTWSVMWIEVLFVPLAVFSRTRLIVWAVMLAVQFGFLVFLNFADLTFPMLLIHAMTFDNRWLPDPKSRRTGNYPIVGQVQR